MQTFHSKPTVRSKRLLIAAVCFLFLTVIIFFRQVLSDSLLLLLCAALVAFLCKPIAVVFEKKLSRKAAALFAILSLVCIALLALWLLVPILINQFSDLANHLPQTVARITEYFKDTSEQLHLRYPGFSLSFPSLNDSYFHKLAEGTIRLAGNAAGTLYRLTLSFVLGFFLLKDRDVILIRMELLIPRKFRSTAVCIGNSVCRELRGYLFGQVMISVLVGSLSALLLALCGIEAPFALGAVVGIFNMIPYFGPVLGGIPAVATALAGGWQKVFLTIAALWAVQQIDSTVISPRIMSGVTGFSPAVVLLAIFVGSGIGGIIGMLIALPLLMAIRTVFRVFVQKRKNV